MSSDEEILTVKKKKYVVDSDLSDTNENVEKQELSDKSDKSEDETLNGSPKKKKKKTRRLKTINSSSESDDDDGDIKQRTNKPTSATSNTSPINSNNAQTSQDERSDSCDSNGESKLPAIEEKQQKPKNSWNKNSDIFTDESSDEDNMQNKGLEHSGDEELELNNSIARSPSPPLQPKERKSKKKALDEMDEIRKQSQRMMREAPVAIPYHRPRQHTLAEFRERRKNTPKISLFHTSDDMLVTAWKAFEQREKEAEAFYKSESSEDEAEEEKEAVQENQPDVGNSENIASTTEIQTSGNEDKSSAESKLITLNNNVENSVEKLETLNGDENSLRDQNYDTENSLVNKSGIELNIEKNDTINSKKQNFVIQETEVDQINDVEAPGCKIHSCSEKQGCSIDDQIEGVISDGLNRDSHPLSTRAEASIDELSTLPSCHSNMVDSLPNTEEFSLRLSESELELNSVSKSNEIDNEFNTINDCGNKIKINTESLNKVQCHLIEINNTETVRDQENTDNNYNEVTNSEYIKEQSNKMDCDEIGNDEMNNKIEDNMKENFDLNKEIFNSTVAMDSIEHKLRMKYNYEPKVPVVSAPKITGAQDGVIDLEEEVSKTKNSMDGLMERFYTHLSYKKKPVKKNTSVDVSITSVETNAAGHVSAINEEIVKVLVGGEEEKEDPALAKPGAKLVRLRAHLRAEIGRQREEQWSKKQQEQRLYEDEIYEGEKDVCDALDAEDETKSDEEKSEEEESEEEEEDLVEDDVIMSEKKSNKKSAFVDDEAEESDDAAEVDDDEESFDSFIKRPTQKKMTLKRTNTEDIFLSQEVSKSFNNIEEDELPSFQKPLPVEGKGEEVEESEGSSVCPSPAFQLTALEGKDVNSYNWSAPTTPCKDFLSPKIVTPVRGLLRRLVDRSPSIGSQDLENLCSGEFVTQHEPEVEDTNTQDFQLFLTEDSQVLEDQTTPVKTPLITRKESLDGKEHMRSLLVDDEELPAAVVSKKVKKLNFSDDEDEGEDSQQVEDNLEGSDVECEDGTPAEEVDYDSEENEVVKTAGDFLDKEAELSEEEWESEDEDERGLDTLDMEEADREQIDQRRLQRELGQMHMKQMLIEDKKEVRLLQEMLLEDGELHSEGRRQRLFRWSNNTFGEEDNKAQIDSDENNSDEEEEEESWRRSRHEREQYLKEHKKKTEQLVEEESDSQLLRLGQKALKRMNSSSQETKLTPNVDPLASPNPKKPFQQLLKRGSFLSRGEQVLSRLAQMAASTDAPVNQPKNSRNFVFASISPTKNDEEKSKNPQPTNKRKKFELPLPIAKKICVQKPKTANKKSLFEALSKVQS